MKRNNSSKRVVFVLMGIWLLSVGVWAEVRVGGSSVYAFMGLPASSRVGGLGGDNVSLSDGEITMALYNPALLSAATDKVVSLNYSYFYQGTMSGAVMYGHNFGRSKIEKNALGPDKPNLFAVGVQYQDYGTMSYANERGDLTGGTFSARDIMIDAIYARQLGKGFTVGVSLKPICSFYERYSAFALGSDVGAQYETKDSLLQVGLSLTNIGWQLKGFYTEEGGQVREMLPLNLKLGMSYRFKHAPIRLSMTIHTIQRWNLQYQLTNQPKTDGNTAIQWYDMMFRHTIFALDILPKSDKFYLTASYNHRRRAEMQLTDSKSLAGFAFAAGVKVKMVRVGFALSQYTKGNLTYQGSLSLDINSLK